MGYVLMLIVALVVFFILRGFMGALAAAVLSCAFLVGWALFNVRAATVGLVRTNLRAYFLSRSMGATHERALEAVIQSRYPFSKDKQERVRVSFGGIPPRSNRGERDDLCFFVHTIFRYETRAPLSFTSRQDEKVIGKCIELYDSMRKEYEISL